jgi:dTDP-4-dehydrorhamnose reductase
MGLHGVFHVSNSEFFHRDELARQFCHALGIVPNVVTKPLAEFHFADKRALKSYLDGSRFANKTGLRFTSMREVFHQFIRRLPPVSPR